MKKHKMGKLLHLCIKKKNCEDLRPELEVRDREAWHTEVHGVTELDTTK